MVLIKELSESNFNDFLELLKQRGEAPEDYYRWKYLKQVINYYPTGFVAYIDNEPVGCIGNINRTYVDIVGKEYPATFFADWYVTQEARGKGVGVALMKQVSNLSPFGFGIPGPSNAQSVAKKAGYFPQTGYYEVSIPCLPFKFGSQQYKGNTITCILRGFRQICIRPRGAKLENIQIVEIKKESSFDYELVKNALKREPAFIIWLYLLPQKAENPRNWYKIITEKGWLLIYVEKDYRNILRGRIIDFKVENQSDNCIIELFLGIRPFLANMGIFFFQAYLHLESKPKLPKTYFKVVPQHVTFQTSPHFHISIADKESGWRDFILGNG